MPRRNILRPLALVGAGSVGLGLGLAGVPGGLPGVAQALVALGGILSGAGTFWFASQWRQRREALSVTPAHVAFMARTPRPMPMPEELPAAPAPRPAAPPSAEASGIARIEGQIRELTRQINKAGVMLATGQLSQEGYRHYVDELKARRGKLEANRVDMQMKR